MLRLAPRIVLHRPDEAARPAPGELWLQTLAPGAAFVFGDGSHPTTRLCAAALATLCRTRAPSSVLDVGTGTGILARIARALGARRVVGTDIDAAALSSAGAHAALDGSALPVEFGDREPQAWGERFELIVTNILQEPLMALAPSLCRALAPGGALLLSGFTRLQAPALQVAFEAQGLQHRATACDGEWVLMHLEAPGGFIDGPAAVQGVQG